MCVAGVFCFAVCHEYCRSLFDFSSTLCRLRGGGENVRKKENTGTRIFKMRAGDGERCGTEGAGRKVRQR